MGLIKWHKKKQYYFGRGKAGHYKLSVFTPPKESGVSRWVAFGYISDKDIIKGKEHGSGSARTIRQAKDILEVVEKKFLRSV